MIAVGLPPAVQPPTHSGRLWLLRRTNNNSPFTERHFIWLPLLAKLSTPGWHIMQFTMTTEAGTCTNVKHVDLCHTSVGRSSSLRLTQSWLKLPFRAWKCKPCKCVCVRCTLCAKRLSIKVLQQRFSHCERNKTQSGQRGVWMIHVQWEHCTF